MSQATPDNFLESDREFFEPTGPLPTAWDEHRRFPRFYFRSCAELIIHPLRGERDPQTPPSIVLTRDLSRGGMSLIHTEQLFPTQRVEIILNDKAPRMMEVLWCRRWINGRYAIGCRFVSDPSLKPEADDANSAVIVSPTSNVPSQGEDRGEQDDRVAQEERVAQQDPVLQEDRGE